MKPFDSALIRQPPNLHGDQYRHWIMLNAEKNAAMYGGMTLTEFMRFARKEMGFHFLYGDSSPWLQGDLFKERMQALKPYLSAIENGDLWLPSGGGGMQRAGTTIRGYQSQVDALASDWAIPYYSILIDPRTGEISVLQIPEFL